MKEENNINDSLNFDNSYDETIGFFSENFYRKDDVQDGNVSVEGSFEESIAEDKSVENKHSVESATENNELLSCEVKVNAFASIDDEGSKSQVVTHDRENIKPNSVIISEVQHDTQPINRVVSDYGSVLEKSQQFFDDERKKLTEFYFEQKKKNQKIGVICLCLGLFIVPLFLAPVFLLKAAKYGKMGKLNLFLHYSTLKWNAVKTATAYEVYENTKDDKFKLHSTQTEPKCFLPKGSNKYLVVAKNQETLIAVSNIISVSI